MEISVSENKKIRTSAIAAVFVLQVMLQIVGAVHYDIFPDWLWSICDALILVTPLIFGLVPGVLCCLPNFIAEILWLVIKGYLGAFLHGAAFMAAVVIAGAAEKVIKKKTGYVRTVLYIFVFEASLILENLLYRALRTVFLSPKTSQFSFDAVFKTTFSLGNAICLLILLFAIYMPKKSLAGKID